MSGKPGFFQQRAEAYLDDAPFVRDNGGFEAIAVDDEPGRPPAGVEHHSEDVSFHPYAEPMSGLDVLGILMLASNTHSLHAYHSLTLSSKVKHAFTSWVLGSSLTRRDSIPLARLAWLWTVW